MAVRIALIHATPVAVDPVKAAFAALWPEADTVNLLDDSLSRDRATAGRLDDAMLRRFQDLADYGIGFGASGILFTCSAFGPAIQAVADRLAIPVLKPNEAMFDAALSQGRRIGMLTSFGPSVASMQEEFDELAKARGSDAAIEIVLVEPAMAALAAGDGPAHDRLLAEAAPRLAGCDVVMLAQFSTARARPSVAAAIDCPVLTSPDSAVARLKAAIARS